MRAHLASKKHNIPPERQEALAQDLQLRQAPEGKQMMLFNTSVVTVAASPALQDAVLALIVGERLPFRLLESPRFGAVLS